ncbi:hypothetical protein DYB32_003159 [Aphanomyces invadans]|uniref:Uncharacterized protein n=1 Tax=Aphanomyces invadans TaxID=157072 RepID=A0A3R6WQ77_9STRA|nr:hypothetical protein DYB32_003159 [Aphanomyces invadans]
MSPIETVRVDGKLSNPPIISTEAELIPYQPQATSNGDDDFGEAAKLNFGFGMEMSSAINPNGLYAHTYAVMKPSAKPPVRKELESALSSAPHVDKAHEVLAECRMKSHHMGNLCDTLRHVLAQHLQDVLGTLAQNMDELSKLGLRREILVDLSTVHPMLSIQVPGEPTPRTIPNLSMKSLINMARTEPAFASRARQNVHLLREYETLMKYFDVKEEYSSAYAIQRLQTLGEDGFLGPYRWDSGGKWKGKPWTKDSMLPSDAELIMNLFCAMLDDVLPATCDTDRPFRRTHYAPSPPTKSASIRGMFLIFCSQVSPPNFKVIANGAVWEILPGKTNVFQAIVLFLHAVKTIADPRMDLTSPPESLHRYFGCDTYLLLYRYHLLAYNDTEETITMDTTAGVRDDEVHVLLSSFMVALGNCNCTLPAFVVIGDLDDQHFMGVATSGLHSTISLQFDTNKVPEVGLSIRSVE